MPRHWRYRLLALAVLTACVAIDGAWTASTAAEKGPGKPRLAKNGAAALVIENDLFGRESLDRDYTNGLELSFLTAPTLAPGWSDPLVNMMTPDRDALETRLHFAVGHQIYTPEDISLDVPVTDDRPYAGLLYGAVGAVLNQGDRRIDQIQMLVGVVGPASQADSIQILYHRIIRAQRPNGWNEQISNRPAFELAWRRTHLVDLYEGSRSRFKVQLAPHYGVRAGNLNTALNVGSVLRVGWNPPVDVTPANLKPSLPGAAFFKPTSNWGWYVYGGVDGRYVPQNIFLDGEARNGNGVTRRNLVGDALVGIAFYRGPVRVGYTHTFRTRQYDEQTRRGSEYGSFSIAINF